VSLAISYVGPDLDISFEGIPLSPVGDRVAVWSYYRFSLSMRDVEDLLADRGVTVSYETIRAYVDYFGPQMASQIRRDRPLAGDKWHIDEIVITSGGGPHRLWRAVEDRGDVLYILVQKRWNAGAARRFFRTRMRRWSQPRVLVTDKFRTYNVALRTDCGSADNRSHKRLNNRLKASRRHAWRQEKIMGRVKSAGQAQKNSGAIPVSLPLVVWELIPDRPNHPVVAPMPRASSSPAETRNC
jgi:putative transposase